MITSKVSRKGLVNIPTKVRESLGIEEGDLLQWTINTRSRTATIRVVKNPAEKLKAKYIKSHCGHTIAFTSLISIDVH